MASWEFSSNKYKVIMNCNEETLQDSKAGTNSFEHTIQTEAT
jgi:hypothetical protein